MLFVIVSIGCNGIARNLGVFGHGLGRLSKQSRSGNVIGGETQILNNKRSLVLLVSLASVPMAILLTEFRSQIPEPLIMI
jgi:hypothetical protein